MAIKYFWSADYQGGIREATFITNDFIQDDPADVYLLPNISADFACNTCLSFHFMRWADRAAIQYNDQPTGNALTYIFPSGTFKLLGTFKGDNVGSGTGTLTITEI